MRGYSKRQKIRRIYALDPRPERPLYTVGANMHPKAYLKIFSGDRMLVIVMGLQWDKKNTYMYLISAQDHKCSATQLFKSEQETGKTAGNDVIVRNFSTHPADGSIDRRQWTSQAVDVEAGWACLHCRSYIRVSKADRQMAGRSQEGKGITEVPYVDGWGSNPHSRGLQGDQGPRARSVGRGNKQQRRRLLSHWSPNLRK